MTNNTSHTGKTSNLTSRFGMNDNVAKPEDIGTTVVGGGFQPRHTGDEYVPAPNPGEGREIHGRGTFGEHFGERQGPIGGAYATTQDLAGGVGGGGGATTNTTGGTGYTTGAGGGGHNTGAGVGHNTGAGVGLATGAATGHTSTTTGTGHSTGTGGVGHSTGTGALGHSTGTGATGTGHTTGTGTGTGIGTGTGSTGLTGGHTTQSGTGNTHHSTASHGLSTGSGQTGQTASSHLSGAGGTGHHTGGTAPPLSKGAGGAGTTPATSHEHHATGGSLMGGHGSAGGQTGSKGLYEEEKRDLELDQGARFNE